MRNRVKQYIDLYLNTTDMKQLKKGYTAHIIVKGQRYAIHATEDKRSRQIAKLEAQLRALKQLQPKTSLKHKYTKRNKTFWENGGNAGRFMNRERKDDKR